MAIDHEIRKAAALWAHTVAQESNPNSVRKAIAKRLLENISPAVPESDSAMTHVVFLVRAFLPVPDEQATQQQITDVLAIVLDTCTKVGAFA